jgi:hypothetical protein
MFCSLDFKNGQIFVFMDYFAAYFQFQTEVSTALNAIHKKGKDNLKNLEGVLRTEVQARIQGEEKVLHDVHNSLRESNAALSALKSDVRSRFQAVAASLERLDTQDQQTTSEVNASVQLQLTHRDREYDRLFHQMTHSVQTVDVRTRDAHHELRQLLHLQALRLEAFQRALCTVTGAAPNGQPVAGSRSTTAQLLADLDRFILFAHFTGSFVCMFSFICIFFF